MSLDRIDREILRILNLKGRLPVVELAKSVNLTTSPCSDRVKRLEKEGYIKRLSRRAESRETRVRRSGVYPYSS